MLTRKPKLGYQLPNMVISWEADYINAGRNYNDSTLNYPLRNHRGEKQSEPVETILAKRSTDAIDTHLEMGICVNNV